MQNEIWKDVPGYSGLYQVSNKGRIKSVERRVNGPKCNGRIVRERILKPANDSDGYKTVVLFNGKTRRTRTIHRLVALAFIPNPDEKKEIDHINAVRADNRVENLRWATRKENGTNPITIQNCIIARNKRICEKSTKTII